MMSSTNNTMICDAQHVSSHEQRGSVQVAAPGWAAGLSKEGPCLCSV